MESKIQHQKEREEILKIQTEIKALKIKSYLEVIKSAMIVIGSIILFWVIQRPESIINQKASKETISRERAKLILELINEDDPQKLALGVSVIEATYPKTEEEWFTRLKNTLEVEAEIDAVNELTERYQQLIIKRQEKYEEFIRETHGTGGTGKPGYGPITKRLESEVKNLDYQISQIEDLLKSYGIRDVKINE